MDLPYPLLSDADFRLAEALRLPTFDLDGRQFLKRVTLITENGMIRKVFYPVFPPDRNAEDVTRYLAAP